MKIAVLSDPHIGPENPVFVPNWNRIVDETNARDDIDLAIILGDLTLFGSEAEAGLPYGRDALEALKMPYLVLPGNHDVGDISRKSHQPSNSDRLQRWEAYFGPGHWHHDFGDDWRLIGINSQIIDTGLAEEAAQWEALEQALATRGDRKAILFTHMPLFLESWDEADRPAWALMREGRFRLKKLIEVHAICAVVTGHMHRTVTLDIPAKTKLVWCAASSFLTYDESMPPQPGFARLGTTILDLNDGAVRVDYPEIDGLMISRIEDYNGSIYRSPDKD